MLLDRTHRTWLFVSIAMLIVAAVGYGVYCRLSPNGPSGGSFMGLLYGIVGSAMMLFAGLLAARKQVPTWRVGSAQFWLRGHIWLGVLSLPMILFHAGFGWGGRVENLLWISFGGVYLSGLFGVALQQFLPRLLTVRVPLETFAAQVPFLTRSMQFQADKLVAERCGKLDVPFENLTETAREVARQRKWLKRDGDFEKLLQQIYERAAGPKTEKKDRPARKQVDPLALARQQAKKSDKASGSDAGSEPEPKSAPTKKRVNPLELARQQAAAKQAGAAAEPDSDDQQKSAPAKQRVSPLELARQQAAKAKAVSENEGAPAPAKKRVNPLELARQQAANANAAAQSVVGTAVEKQSAPVKKSPSPLELARQQAAKAKAASARSNVPAGMNETTRTRWLLKRLRAEGAFGSGNKGAGKDHLPKPGGSTKMPAVKRAKPKPPPVAPRPKTVAQPTLRTDVLKEFYVRDVRPFLDEAAPRAAGKFRGARRNHVFAQLRSDLPIELHDILAQLERYCEEKHQFGVQARIHRWMRSWLILHIPFTIALTVLFVAHVIMALRVVPFSF